MKAEQVIELIQKLEPLELKKLFVLIKEYEAQIHSRRVTTDDDVSEEFKKIAHKVFSENDGLFKKLAAFEAKERETSAT
ncbi:MAG TPA: hypothetical protein VG347_06360 [Verrucomicrobiae bacterium]|nr:hypothetical protein [Verrucomicrobiae bacterium]